MKPNVRALAALLFALPPTFAAIPILAASEGTSSRGGVPPGETNEQATVRLLNEFRLDNGALPPLKQNSLLAQSAASHAQSMAVNDFAGRCDPTDGSKPRDRITAAGYAWVSAEENIAIGQPGAVEVIGAWNSVLGQRNNMLSTDLRESAPVTTTSRTTWGTWARTTPATAS